MKLITILENRDERMTAFREAMASATAKVMKDTQLRNVEDINHGWCWDWSTAVENFFYDTQDKEYQDDLIEIGDEDLGHYFLEFRGRLYDAETPGGVITPSEFPLASRIRAHDPRCWP